MTCRCDLFAAALSLVWDFWCASKKFTQGTIDSNSSPQPYKAAPSREWSHIPLWEKEIIDSKVIFDGIWWDMLAPRRVTRIVFSAPKSDFLTSPSLSSSKPTFLFAVLPSHRKIIILKKQVLFFSQKNAKKTPRIFWARGSSKCLIDSCWIEKVLHHVNVLKPVEPRKKHRPYFRLNRGSLMGIRDPYK